MVVSAGFVKAGDVLNLSEEEITKMERINQAIADRENAEAAKESQQKMRILFERAARDALPFIVYVVYIGSVNTLVLFRILAYEGQKLWIASALLVLGTLAPLLILPRSSIWWLKKTTRKALR